MFRRTGGGEAVVPDDRLAEMHRAHYADLVRYFARRGALNDADELAAEVFVIAWRKLPGNLDDPRPWLFGVARKVLAGSRRRRERKTGLDLPLDEAGESALSVSAHSGEISIRTDLQRAWNRLKPADQEILALTAWEGLTAAEAAVVLGVRRSGAAMRLSRARERLRALLYAPRPTAPLHPQERS
ncbi:hypothetical protein SUDANB121_02923 [Nocardiopsis dassonvillei]|uniref:RNA polymerase sigma factor n=1 Tax=Nocardiopsis dassonvillei TaxID=2014 RepID=UPI003F54F660